MGFIAGGGDFTDKIKQLADLSWSVNESRNKFAV
jgi:hypothetical protein